MGCKTTWSYIYDRNMAMQKSTLQETAAETVISLTEQQGMNVPRFCELRDTACVCSDAGQQPSTVPRVLAALQVLEADSAFGRQDTKVHFGR